LVRGAARSGRTDTTHGSRSGDWFVKYAPRHGLCDNGKFGRLVTFSSQFVFLISLIGPLMISAIRAIWLHLEVWSANGLRVNHWKSRVIIKT
jgi:hypothetical protein